MLRQLIFLCLDTMKRTKEKKGWGKNGGKCKKKKDPSHLKNVRKVWEKYVPQQFNFLSLKLLHGQPNKLKFS